LTANIEKVKEQQYVYLTTKGRKTGKPHKVELWFAYYGGRVYLSHEGQRTDWMRNALKNERVGVRIGSVEFEAKAKVAAEGSRSREEGARALYEKYYEPAPKEKIDDWFSLSTVIELTPLGET
jgi:deazaflavin-dependent oxidoreductase (nitroreductase family)